MNAEHREIAHFGDKSPLLATCNLLIFIKRPPISMDGLLHLVRPKGIEPPTSPLGGERSIQLSYERIDIVMTK